MTLRAQHLVLGYGDQAIVEVDRLEINLGEITTIVGPNGCGKSTLLKGLSGLMTAKSGDVWLDDQPLQEWSSKARARRLAVLSQNPVAPDDISVRQLVEHGRYPHQTLLSNRSQQDEDAVNWALQITGMEAFANRSFNTLSGGEKQRGWIALALAQQADILLVDEPTTFLDIGRQLEIMALLTRLNQEFGTTIVMVLHDMNQASRFSQRIIAMQQGQTLADGTPSEVINSVLLERLFRIRAEVIPREDDGVRYPYCLPIAAAPE